jgi:dTDP-4-dehydrorhamnose reductase
MQKKLMIFGGGFVGRNLSRVAVRQGWQVVLADMIAGQDEENIRWITLDITDEKLVETAIASYLPDAAVNVAAMADIDKAESNKEAAYRINVEAARYIAESCKKHGTKYVFFSSDAVFEGTKEIYTEEDERNPINYYGTTKMIAEDEVRKANPQAAVARLSLILGFTIAGGNSFLEALERKLRAGDTIYCPLDEMRTPIDVMTLCACVLELAQNNFAGVLQLGSKDSIDRYTMTRLLAEKLGYDTALVQIQKDTPQGRALRHKNGIISVKKAQSVLKTPLLPVSKTIERALNSRQI